MHSFQTATITGDGPPRRALPYLPRRPVEGQRTAEAQERALQRSTSGCRRQCRNPLATPSLSALWTPPRWLEAASLDRLRPTLAARLRLGGSRLPVSAKRSSEGQRTAGRQGQAGAHLDARADALEYVEPPRTRYRSRQHGGSPGHQPLRLDHGGAHRPLSAPDRLPLDSA